MLDVRGFGQGVRGAILITGLGVIFWAEPAAAQTPVRIAAANITSGNGQDYQAPGTRIFQGLDPDIVLIQEFNVPGTNDAASVSAWVSSTFGPDYYWYREPGSQSIPNGIISRYPFLETGEWNDTQVPDRDFAWARIDVPGSADLWAISVHLKTSSSSTQNAQVQLILNAMQSKGVPTTDYVVIGGDFNTSGRTVAPIQTLGASSWDFETGGPYPVGEDNDSDTNAGRTSPYDWVLPSAALDALKAPTVYASTVSAGSSRTYTSGLVFDTRDFSQSTLNEFFPPALTADSGASSMQHMAVVRTFLFPESLTVSDGTEADVAVTDRAPAEASPGGEVPMLSVEVSVSGAEWDGASLKLMRTVTLAEALVTAKVYLDADNDGAIDAGDKLLGSASFSSGEATAGLGAPAPRATAGRPIRLLASAVIGAGAPEGATLQFYAAANGLTSAASGGNDPDPTYSETASGTVTITSEPPPPPVVSGTPVVVNKFYNQGSTAAQDAVELLVIQDGLDMRGMILKDFSSSMGSDGGGKFAFSSAGLWSSVRAGTVMVLRNNATAADTSAGGTDFHLDVGMGNSTYFTSLGGTFDIAGTDMVMIKTAGSGGSGIGGAIHTLAAGTAGSNYENAAEPKLRSTTASSGSNPFVYATCTGPLGNARLGNYSDAGGTAATGSGLTLGEANTSANADFIALLRGPTAEAATNILEGQFTAHWSALAAAADYRLDVARDSAFSSYVAGYAQLGVGAAASFVVDGLSEGTYYYRVSARDTDGRQGRASSSVSVILPVLAQVEDWSAY